MSEQTEKHIAPIQTRYHGYHFRSRLEARWAVFFEEIGLKWEYEVEGYDLGKHGWYLPDFLIHSPQGNKHIYEIKPLQSKNGNDKLEALISFMNKEIVNKSESDGWVEPPTVLLHSGSVLCGDPYELVINNVDNKMIICPRCGLIQLNPTMGSDWCWIGCAACDFQTPGGHDNPSEKSLIFDSIEYVPHKGTIMLSDKNLEKYNKILKDAANKSRSARFEHGESGPT